MSLHSLQSIIILQRQTVACQGDTEIQGSQRHNDRQKKKKLKEKFKFGLSCMDGEEVSGDDGQASQTLQASHCSWHVTMHNDIYISGLSKQTYHLNQGWEKFG